MKEILTFEGTNTVIIWKHPQASIGYNTQVIVPYSHEAIYVKDGLALDTLLPGKHILNENASLLSRLKKTPGFTSMTQLYFINKSVNLLVPWGTPSMFDIFDSKLNIPIRLGARGEFEVRVSNSRKLLMKVVGSENFNADMLADFFRGKVLLYIKDTLARVMIKNKISFYELSSYLKIISMNIKENLSDVFDEYGVTLESFIISDVEMPNEIRKILEQEYLKEKTFTIHHAQAPEKAKSKETIHCKECGSELPVSSNFCNVCGAKVEEVREAEPVKNKRIAIPLE